MSANSYGIIVEGHYDAAVYDAIIRKLTSSKVYIKPLECGGKTELMKKFPGFLSRLQYEVDGGPVDMAVVIRDADGKNPQEVEAQMDGKIRGRNYPFRLGVRFHAVHQAMDAWLLADVDAINGAGERRGGRQIRTRLPDAPEGLVRPKESLRGLLGDHKVSYTAEVCREIAERVELGTLRQRCPRFRIFEELVDC
jgi:hypothetical protein